MVRKRLHNGPKLKAGKKLTEREQRFVEKMTDPSVKSARQAAIEAGYSDKNAASIAYQNSIKLHISEAIEKRKAEVLKLASISPQTILGAAVRQAFASIRDCMEDGYFDFEKACETGAIDLVKSISWGKNGQVARVEMYSADSARKELGEYYGLKQLPRENEEKIRKAARALTLFMEDFPDRDREKALAVFAKTADVDIEELRRHAADILELEGVN